MHFSDGRILQIGQIQYKDSFSLFGRTTMEATLKTLLVAAAAVAGAIGLGLAASPALADGSVRRVDRGIDRSRPAVLIAHRHRHRTHHHTHTRYYGIRYSYPRTSVRYAWPHRGYYDYGRARDYERYW